MFSIPYYGDQTQKGLDSSLWSPIDTGTRREIVASPWDFDDAQSSLSDVESALNSFFQYYAEQIVFMMHTGGRYNSVRTHRDLINIIAYLKQGKTKNDIKQELRANPLPMNLESPDEAIGRSVDLAGRLLVMLALGNIPQGFPGSRGLPWDANASLQQCVTKCFTTTQVLQAERVRLEKMFVGGNFHRIARITIVWTDNLADHLRMFEHETCVAIFHHAAFLEIVRSRWDVTDHYFPFHHD